MHLVNEAASGSVLKFALKFSWVTVEICDTQKNLNAGHSWTCGPRHKKIHDAELSQIKFKVYQAGLGKTHDTVYKA